MRKRLLKFWIAIPSSLWFVPGLLAAGGIAAAVGLVALDVRVDSRIVSAVPILGMSSTGARDVLSAIATSIITVAGVVFSITTVALSLAANQYSPRTLNTFMSDRGNQFAIGYFTAVFAYSLLVLRSIRTNAGGFVPLLAVLAGMLLGVCSAGVLIFFVHHISASMHSGRVVARAAELTVKAIDAASARRRGDAAGEGDGNESCPPGPWFRIPASETGYVQSIDAELLTKIAAEHETVVRMELAVGGFAIEGMPLAWSVRKPSESLASAVNGAVLVNDTRTIEQDPLFGISQIVDVGLKALSPGINDTTTALACVDRLTAVLLRLAVVPPPSPNHFRDGKLRVVTRENGFFAALELAFDRIRQNARDNVAVTVHQLEALERIAAAIRDLEMKRALLLQAERIHASAAEFIKTSYDAGLVRRAFDRFRTPSGQAQGN